ncbi:MAG: carbon-nitrogen hydrolase [Desulfuromonadaceae bacterium]|nr:carbon-nitrogen hydrolase [Desulfuromonas sp.]MDY0185623.1 carbon-nitrogen hydrolase [Desulfuromonadaceae bacterium]
MNKLKLALIQQQCGPDKDTNLRHSGELIRQAAGKGARLVVLIELHNDLYFCQHQKPEYFDKAESIPGPSTAQLAQMARENQVVLVTSLFEKRAPGLYHNTGVVFEADGSIAGIYRKMHIPDDPGYNEKYYFTPGDLGFNPIQTSVGSLGLLICWDQWYPEAARLMALAGADILIYPTAIGWDSADTSAEQQRQLDAWITIQRSHAVANGTYVAAVNRIGFEADPSGITAGAQFWGNSFVAGPQGEIIAQAGAEKEEIVLTEIDLHRAEDVRRIWPFLRDRRVDAYADLTKRFRD